MGQRNSLLGAPQKLIGNLLSRPGLKKFAGSFSWMILERFVFMAVTILVNIPLARHLGPDRFGVYNYVVAIAAIVTSFSAIGLNHIVTRDLIERPLERGSILGTVTSLRVSAAVLALAIMAGWLHFFGPSDSQTKQYIYWSIGAGVFGTLTFLQFWFVAEHKANAFAIATIINTLFFAAIRVVQILNNASLRDFMLLAALEIAGTGLVLLVAYYRVAERPLLKWSFDLPTAKSLLAKSVILTVSSITAVIYLKIDIVMLANMSSNKEAGIYSAASRLSEAWYFVPNILMTALLPFLVKLRADSREAYEKRLQDTLDACSMLAFLLAICVTIFSRQIINLFYGEAYSAAALILSIHIWSGIFVFMRQVLSKWFIMEDLYAFSLISQVCGAVVNVLLNYLMIPILGGVGSAVATLISYATASYLALFLTRRTWGFALKMTRALFWPRRLIGALQAK